MIPAKQWDKTTYTYVLTLPDKTVELKWMVSINHNYLATQVPKYSVFERISRKTPLGLRGIKHPDSGRVYIIYKKELISRVVTELQRQRPFNQDRPIFRPLLRDSLLQYLEIDQGLFGKIRDNTNFREFLRKHTIGYSNLCKFSSTRRTNPLIFLDLTCTVSLGFILDHLVPTSRRAVRNYIEKALVFHRSGQKIISEDQWPIQ